MSRIGKQPISLPAGVTVSYEGNVMTVKGPKGTLTQDVVGDIDVQVDGNTAKVVTTSDTRDANAKHGLYRALLQNMVTGVSSGFTKTLTIAGIGWKANMQGQKLVLNVGYSHPVDIVPPAGITIACPTATQIDVSGIDKVLVGQVAANIRSVRKPEPYHGYGISYKDEVIERKEGKTGGKGKK